MVNLSRPLLRSSGTRLPPRSRDSSPELQEKSATTATATATAAPTRRSAPTNKARATKAESKSDAATAQAPDPKVTSLGPKATRNSSRKSAGRPPTKLSVTQPHGALIQTTNGVRTELPLRADEVPSRVATPASTTSDSTGLAPPVTTSDKDRRATRSQDTTPRLKSNLAAYFPDYKEILANGPRKPDFLGFDDPIHIVNEALKTPNRVTADTTETVDTPDKVETARGPLDAFFKPKAAATTPVPEIVEPPPKTPPRPTSAITTFETLDLASLAGEITQNEESSDPLADSVFLLPHRREERKEKHLRNLEKEKAQHDKQKLEELLEDLRGPDWLRVMGVPGVIESERRDWEPKRDYFIAEVGALVDKFEQWKEGEKRLKMEREAALHAKEADEVTTEESDEVDSSVEEPGTDPPQTDETDTNPSLHRRQEANTTGTITRKSRKPRHLQLPEYLPPPEVDPNKPFTSFYAKPHQRAAALGNKRHGRGILALGHVIPDFQEREFALPGDYLTEEALRDHARKRRRMKRDSGVEKGKRIA